MVLTSSSDVVVSTEFDFLRIEREVNEALQRAAEEKLAAPRSILVISMPLPCTRLTEMATQYVAEMVDPLLFTHSLRTYYFGTAIASVNFPHLRWNPETFYLACILHDIGYTHSAFRESRVSSEFYGGMLARSLLLSEGSTRDVADTVMEAICRHKDSQSSTSGHSPEGQMLMFGTQLDVFGNYSGLINRRTVDDIIAKYPRSNFNNLCADLLLDEINVKHYCTGVGFLKGSAAGKIRKNSFFADAEAS